MKTILVLAVIVLVALSLSISVPVSAGEKMKVKGKVEKIDTANKSITIKPKKGDAVTVVYEDADVFSKVEERGNAKAYYVVEGGVNKGSKLRKITTGCD